MKADAGRRLENLFWRIWSNNSILRTIKGTTLAGLFLHISEGESITGMARGRLREVCTLAQIAGINLRGNVL